MQSVFNKHGAFKPEVLGLEHDITRRIVLEQSLLDRHFDSAGCVNAQSQAEVPPMTGRKHSEASRQKMALAKLGKPLSEAHKRALSEAQTGHLVSDETRQKLSAAGKGRKRPDTAARNKSVAGWNHTDETRAKIRDASRTGGFRGRSHSDATKARISKALSGRKQDPEVVARRAASIRKACAARKVKQEHEASP